MRTPQTGAAVACFALAIAFGAATAHFAGEADTSRRIVPVEAAFSRASIRHDVRVRQSDGTMQTGDETIVDAVFQLDGKTYRRSVTEEYAMRVVSRLPARGVILVDPRDPTRPPRSVPVGLVAAPLLACIFSALLGLIFGVSAWRNHKANDD